MELAAGTHLQNGAYILGDLLSQGSVSMTFRALQTATSQPVIIKTVKPNPQLPIDFLQIRQGFVQEARQFAQCHHPALASVSQIFEEHDRPFVVMDYVPGRSLADRVQQQGPLPEAEALPLLPQIGSALGQLHRQGVMHQDVKPRNLLALPDTQLVVLVDFGVAYQSLLTEMASPLVLSVEEYAAPEQHRSTDRPTPAADVYALAATLYFLLTGTPPTRAILRSYTPLPAPRQLKPDLSPAVEAAILSGMELNPQSRPPSIAAWFALLPNLSSASSPPEPIAAQPVRLAPTSDPSPAANVVKPYPATVAAKVPPTPTTVKTQAVAPAPSPAQPAVKRQVPGKKVSSGSLLMAGVFAAIGGGVLGLGLRMTGATGPGSSIFHTEQAFPPLKDWDGVAKPTKTASPAPQPKKAIREAVPEAEWQAPPAVPARSRRERPPAAPIETPAPRATPELDPSPAPSPAAQPVAPIETPAPIQPSSPAVNTPPLEPPAAPAAAPTPEPIKESTTPPAKKPGAIPE